MAALPFQTQKVKDFTSLLASHFSAPTTTQDINVAVGTMLHGLKRKSPPILQHHHRSAQLQNFQQKRSVLFCKHFTKLDSLRDTTTDWIMFCNHFKRVAGTNFAPPQVFSDSFGIASLCLVKATALSLKKQPCSSLLYTKRAGW